MEARKYGDKIFQSHKNNTIRTFIIIYIHFLKMKMKACFPEELRIELILKLSNSLKLFPILHKTKGLFFKFNASNWEMNGYK